MYLQKKALMYSKSIPDWVIKYKLYHIPFWFLYHYFLWTVTIGNPIKAANSMLFTPFAIKFGFYAVFQAAAVYFNIYFLLPKYLKKGRFAAYLSYLLLTIIVAALLIVPGYYLSAYATGHTVRELYGAGACIYLFIGNALPATIAAMTFAMSIKLTKNWIQTERRHQLLENEKLETELKFLKNQFNPHFLFNTINSIFFLIHKNPDKASASLAKFSDLLRYQLYECNDQQIPLSKEISFLENSIELERLRLNKNIEVTFRMDQQPVGHLGVAPFILMPFVENAFKHVSKDTDKDNWIRIRLDIDQQRLDFSISNSVSQNAFKEVISYGGIGLKNVRRRLDLLYPGQYNLDIQNDNSSFAVRLQLQLATLIMPRALQATA
jgi:hypothetical protein